MLGSPNNHSASGRARNRPAFFVSRFMKVPFDSTCYPKRQGERANRVNALPVSTYVLTLLGRAVKHLL